MGSGFVHLKPFNQVLPRVFLKDYQSIKDFQPKDGDVWVSSFPKCGTTWTQELVWCLMNDLDFVKAKDTRLDERVKFFELSSITELEEELKFFGNTIEQVQNDKSDPRIIKTHLSWQMLPARVKSHSNAKIVYVTRNPRDACVSYYNHWRVLEGYKGTFEDFAEAFVNDVCGYYAPFLPHVKEYWEEQKLRKNVFFVTYEEMKRDLRSVVSRLAAFLGKEETVKDSEKMGALLNHLSFDKMKTNKAVNKAETVELCTETKNKEMEAPKFMRKGQVGDWKNWLSPEQLETFKTWEKKGLEDTDFKFTYEL